MSNSNNNQLNIPQAHEAMDRFKMQAAQEVGVNLTNGYNGHLTSLEVGDLGNSRWSRRFVPYETYISSETFEPLSVTPKQ